MTRDLTAASSTVPVDLAAVLALSVATCVGVLTPLIPAAVQIPFVIPFALLFPGYVVTAALFPERPQRPASDDSGQIEGIRGVARVTLSVALSAVLTPLVGLVVLFLGVGFGTLTITVALAAVNVCGAVVAAWRRAALRPDRRFRLPVGAWRRGVRSRLQRPWRPRTVAVNALLVSSLLLAVAGGAYALTADSETEGYTEFYLLSENESGELIAGDYPTFEDGEASPLTVAVTNHEGRQVDYTVVVRLQQVTADGEVTASERLQTFSVAVGDERRALERRQIAPDGTGDRLQLLLYRGDPPATPTAENAYRHTHLRIGVTASSKTATPGVQ